MSIIHSLKKLQEMTLLINHLVTDLFDFIQFMVRPNTIVPSLKVGQT